MRSYLALLIPISIFIMSCDSQSPSQMTNTGYEYKVYHDASGAIARPGQYVYYFLDVLNDRDSLLQTNRKNPSRAVTMIPLTEDTAGAPLNPIMDVMMMSSVGDSIGLILPKDSIPNLPPQFSNITHIEYKIVVQEIVDEAIYKDRVEKERAEAQILAEQLKEREGDVAELVTSTIKKFNDGSLKNDLKTVEGDLQYLIIEEGTGALAENGTVALAQYYGSKLNGESFDNSFKRGRGFPVNVGAGGVIPGWDKTFPFLKEGDKAFIFIPSDLGYGEMGSPPNIGPNEDLVFYVEIENVQ